MTAAEFAEDMPDIFQAMDQPSIDGVNTWFVSKAAQELGLKVAISGLGGDELFGGYPSFRDIPRWVARLALPASLPLLGGIARRAIAGTGGLIASPKAAGMLEYGGTYAGAYLLRRGLFMPWELEQVLGKDTARQGLAALQPLAMIEEAMTPRPASGFARVAALESCLYMRNQLLRDTDWASMAHSLEVRVPLVDAHLLETVAPFVAAAAASEAFPKETLALSPCTPPPQALLHRAKTGFGVPTGSWISYLTGEPAEDAGARAAAFKGEGSRAWSRIVLNEAFA